MRRPFVDGPGGVAFGVLQPLFQFSELARQRVDLVPTAP